MTPLSLGISNSNYKVELADQIVLLKISNDKGIDALKAEQKILFTINKYSYPHSLKPFAMSNGEWVYSFGDYIGVVYPFVQGIPPGPSDFTCFEVGKALAKLHQIKVSNEDKLNLRRHEEVGFGATEIINYCQSLKCPEDFKRSVYELFPDKLESFIKAPFEKCVIHGDLYYDNTLFDNNVLSTVLDFEQSGIGEAILDLGISISGTCLEKGRLITPLIESYMRGYESIRPLPALEKSFFHDAIIVGFLSISLWRIKRFTEGNLNPLMRDSYKDLLTKALMYKELL